MPRAHPVDLPDKFVSYWLAISVCEIEKGPGTGPRLINGAEGGDSNPHALVRHKLLRRWSLVIRCGPVGRDPDQT